MLHHFESTGRDTNRSRAFWFQALGALYGNVPRLIFVVFVCLVVVIYFGFFGVVCLVWKVCFALIRLCGMFM